MKRVILGYNGTGPNAGYGFWVSKPSKDAGSSNVDDFLIVPGRTNAVDWLSGIILANASIPLASQGSQFTISFSNGSAQVIPCIYGLYFTHGLGYVPMVWSDLNNGSPTYYVAPNNAPYTTGPYGGQSSFYAGFAGNDNTHNSYIVMYADTNSVGVEFHGNMVVGSTYYSSSGTYTLATSVTLNAPVHYAVMGLQVA